MKVKILFWNINGKSVGHLIRQLLDTHTPDVVVLAECTTTIGALLQHINHNNSVVYDSPINPSRRLVFLTRLPAGHLSIVSDDEGMGVAIRRVTPILGDEFLLVGVHLPSKLHQKGKDQSMLAPRLRELIDEAESRYKHQRTVVIGDLNMDPFEPGVVSSEALHGVMDQQIALKLSRSVQKKERSFFYNPMWSYLGDRSVGPSGTYYYRDSTAVAYRWHTFDQVLIRPSLIAAFNASLIPLQVLTTAGNTQLLHNGYPDQKNASDHLPVLLDL